MKLRKRDVPKAACKQTVHAKRRGEMLAITTTRKPPPIFERGLSLRSYLLGLGFQLNNMALPKVNDNSLEEDNTLLRVRQSLSFCI